MGQPSSQRGQVGTRSQQALQHLARPVLPVLLLLLASVAGPVHGAVQQAAGVGVAGVAVRSTRAGRGARGTRRLVTEVKGPYLPKAATSRAEFDLMEEKLVRSALSVKHILPDDHKLAWGKCPEWIANYTAGHTALREEGRLLFYYCDNDLAQGSCAGTGDRIRGIQEAMRMAYASNRALAIKWWDPLDLELFLEPASDELDWRGRPEFPFTAHDTFDKLPKFIWFQKPSTPKALLDGSFLKMKDPVVLMSTSSLDTSDTLPGPHLGHRCSNERSCVFNALFQPSPALKSAVANVQRQLFGGTDVPYIAVHLRLGGFNGERRNIVRFNQFYGLLSAMSCARLLARHLNVTAPVLLVTDNALLRHLVAAGAFEDLVGPPGAANHLHHAAIRGLLQHVSSEEADAGSIGLGGQSGELVQRAMERLVEQSEAAGGLGADEGGARGLLSVKSSHGTSEEPAVKARGPLIGPPVDKAIVAGHMTTYADMGLLAAARCLIYSPSGFSDTAIEWGRHSCAVSVGACVDLYEREPGERRRW